MAKEIIFNLTLNDNLDKTNKSIDELISGLEDADQKFGELEKAARNAALAGDEALSKTYAEAAGNIKRSIDETNASIDNFASKTKNLDVVIGTARGIAAAFATVQGTMALFGEENKELEKTLLKVQGSLAVLNGLTEVSNVLSRKSQEGARLHAAANAILNSSILMVNGTLSAFKVALATTGVGAFIVVLAALYNRYQEVKAKNEEATAAQVKYKEAVRASKQAVDDKIASLDLEIIAMKNFVDIAGANLIRAKAEKETLEEQIAAREKYNDTLKESGRPLFENGKSLLFEVDTLKKNLVLKNEEILNLQRIADKTKELTDLQNAKNNSDNKQVEISNKKGDAYKKEVAFLEAMAKLKVKYDQSVVQMNAEAAAAEQKQLDDKEAKGFAEQEAENAAAAAVIDANNAKIKSDQEAAQKRKQIAMDTLNFTLQQTQIGLKAISDLNDAQSIKEQNRYDADRAALDAQLENSLISREEYDRRLGQLDKKADADAKKRFENSKKIQIAQALISTYFAANQAYASQFLPVPDASSPIRGAIAAGVAVISGLANVQKIRATQYNSPNSSTSGGGIGGGSIGGGGTPVNPFATNERPSGVINLTTRPTDQSPQRVFVVESDITTVQNRVSVIENNAKIM